MREDEIHNIKLRFGIIGNSLQLNNAVRIAIQVAPTDMSVLISGESGTGKESFSKIIHSLSHRKHGEFIAINCGAIPEGTIDSELFGHEKGSFTGAYESRKGYFESANGGTLFLDEIGEMPMSTQARLLRVLEYGEFIKVGSSKVQKTNTRVIGATNVDLLNAIEQKRFREDLYYRLNTVNIQIPPLRDRGEDIERLFRKFASDFAEKYQVQPLSLSPEARQILIKYRFPGNIRQLKNMVEQMSVLEITRELSVEKIATYIPQSQNLPSIFLKVKTSENELNERDILYKILFDMRKDVADLKKLVFKLLENSDQRNEILQTNRHLFETEIETEEKLQTLGETNTSQIVISPSKRDNNNKTEDAEEIEETLNIDITEEGNNSLSIEKKEEETLNIDITEEENNSLSIEKKEKELITTALRRNNFKRKNAATQLGISERTLYRKIKEYGLEDM